MQAGERAACRLSRHGLSLWGGSNLRLAGAVPSPPGAAELRSGSVLALSPNKWESRHPHPSAPQGNRCCCTGRNPQPTPDVTSPGSPAHAGECSLAAECALLVWGATARARVLTRRANPRPTKEGECTEALASWPWQDRSEVPCPHLGNNPLMKACSVGSPPSLVLIPYLSCASCDHLLKKMYINPWTAFGVTESNVLSTLAPSSVHLPSPSLPAFCHLFLFLFYSSLVYSQT